MPAGKGLAMIFGEPKPGGEGEPEMGASAEYPEGFEDACEMAFDALRAKDSRGFCSAMLDVCKAYEGGAHSEPAETEED